MSGAHGSGGATAALDIDSLVDGQTFGRFNLLLLLWSFLAMLADGYDISALASAAPELARTWHLPAKAFGPAFSASLFGVLFGAPLLGSVGDRFGRRVAIVGGCLIYGLGTLATVAAANLDQIIVLRFVTGIGIGGLMPNTIALNSELAPKRLRATLIVLMFTGITTGSGLPGYIQAWLIPRYGWPIMFWIGGLAPLAVAACLLKQLPESVKYLAPRPRRRSELLATLRRMRPELVIADTTVIGAPATPGGAGLGQLFSGGLTWITPLLWGCFASALMANFFLTSWLPLVLVGSGLSTQQSGITTSFYHYGSTLGGLLVSLVLGRFGFSAVALLFLLAIPAIAAIGGAHSQLLLAAAVATAGFSTLGAQFGNNAASGLLYPTAALRCRWSSACWRAWAWPACAIGGSAACISTINPWQTADDTAVKRFRGNALPRRSPMATGRSVARSMAPDGRDQLDGLLTPLVDVRVRRLILPFAVIGGRLPR
jgi:AAHS family 4-hydroxybenzoate transporter-like MFS transporter